MRIPLLHFRPTCTATMTLAVMAVAGCGGQPSAPAPSVGWPSDRPAKDRVVWLSIDEAQQRAAADGRPLFLLVWAVWDVGSMHLRNALAEPDIAQILGRQFHPVLVDLSRPNPRLPWWRLKRHGVLASPAVVIEDVAGRALFRHTDSHPASLLTWLRRL